MNTHCFSQFRRLLSLGCLFALLLIVSTQPARAQSADSSYCPPVCYSPADTLVAKPHYRQTQTENRLLRKQNARLLDKSARFWGLLILAAIVSLAQAASR